MRRIFILLIGLFAITHAIGQGFAINTDGTTANTSSMLDVKSINKGVLLPRLTTAERNAIPLPANGLIVYNTTDNEFNYYNGSSWQSWNSNWLKNGNNIYNRNFNTGFVGMGTNNPLARLHVADSPVVFMGSVTTPAGGNLSSFLQGAGTRLLWHPQKAAFRAGYVDGTQWNNDSIGLFSFAAGYNSKAKGFGDIVIGYDNESYFGASAIFGGANRSYGAFNFSTGQGNTLYGNYNTAMGLNNYTSGELALAIGNGNLVVDSGIAIGTNNYSNGFHNNIVIGSRNIPEGIYTTALGWNNRASLIFSFAAGYGNYSSGEGSVSIGMNNTASGEFSAAIGNNTVAKAQGGISVGMYNDNSDVQVSGLSSRIFQIGNGSSSFFRSNAVTVLKNGFVGIGTVTPQETLEVAGNVIISAGGVFRYPNGTQAGGRILYCDALGNAFWNDPPSSVWSVNGTDIYNNNSGYVGIGVTNPGYLLDLNGRMRIRSGGANASSAGIWFNNNANTLSPGFVGMESDGAIGFYGNGTPNGWGVVMNIATGNVGIGTSIPSQKLHVIGNILATGTITPSDIRYKTDIHGIQNSLARIISLSGVTYFMNRMAFPQWNFDSTLQYGLIAQEVEKIFPEMVTNIDEKGYKGINYVKLVPVLIEGFKEMNSKIEATEKENKELKLQMNLLLKRIEDLEQK